MAATFAIAYISPNGSTKKVAETIAEQLSKLGATPVLTDLSNTEDTRALIRAASSDEQTFLFIGTPVYMNMAVPPVMTFIEELSSRPGGWAVPFATYGVACSGIALWQMANALTDRGFRIAGAAKIAALHSMMWTSTHPEGADRPDTEDLSRVRFLVETLVSRLSSGTLAPLDLSALDYQKPELSNEFKAKLTEPWQNIPRTVDADLCEACGECAQGCPVDAIELDPTPSFGDACFGCCNCVRLCPNEAIIPAMPLANIEEMICKRIETINERPLSQAFLPVATAGPQTC